MPGHVDTTIYGASPLATRSFFTHHLSAIASAAVTADALTIENAAAATTFHAAHFPALPIRLGG